MSSSSEAWQKKIPFWANEANVVVEEFLKPEFQAFEWGSGASTIWLAQRVTKLISIEHDSTWYQKVAAALKKMKIHNVELKFLSGKDYPEAIRKYPNELFDFIAIDGRQRVACLKEVILKVRYDGLLLVDDSQRVRYQEGIALLASWSGMDFTGDGRQTSLFNRRRN